MSSRRAVHRVSRIVQLAAAAADQSAQAAKTAGLHGSRVRFIFRGKSGVEHELDLDDRRLARIVRQCRDLPGQELFQYRDDDARVIDIGSAIGGMTAAEAAVLKLLRRPRRKAG